MKSLLINRKATIDLPLHMVVAVIVGGAALGTITYYMLSNCWIEKKVQVSWQPSYIIFDENINTYSVEVYVKDDTGDPIKNAFVAIGGHAYATGKTNENGMVKLTFSIDMPDYRKETYLSIEVRAGSCYEKFRQEDAIKVIRG